MRYNVEAVCEEHARLMRTETEGRIKQLRLAWILLSITMIVPVASSADKKRQVLLLRFTSCAVIVLALSHLEWHLFATPFHNTAMLFNVCYPQHWIDFADCLGLNTGIEWAWAKAKEELSAAWARLACSPPPERRATTVLALPAPSAAAPPRGKSPGRRFRSPMRPPS